MLEAGEATPYENCIPLMSVEAATGGFGEAHEIEPEAWVEVDGVRPSAGLFVARVTGESMNRRIPNGAYRVFRAPVEGSRNGRVLLVRHRDIADPEHGGSYTVKIYERQGEIVNDDGERRSSILLKPGSTDPASARSCSQRSTKLKSAWLASCWLCSSRSQWCSRAEGRLGNALFDFLVDRVILF